MLEKIEYLKQKLSAYKTEEIVGMLANYMLYIPDQVESIQEKTGLDSTDMQFKYILGLLLSTKYVPAEISDNHIEIDAVGEFLDDISSIFEEVKKITDSYFLSYLPNGKESTSKLAEFQRATIMSAFIGYFYQSTLCHENQIVERIERWFFPFNKELNIAHEIDAELLLNFYEFISEKMRSVLEASKDAGNSMYEFWFENFGKYSDEDIDNMSPKEMEALYNNIINNSQKDVIAQEVQNTITNIYCVSEQELLNQFGAAATKAFIYNFAIERGTFDFTYFTEINPTIDKPLIKISDDRYMIINNRMLLDAIYNFLYKSLEVLKNNSFYEIRGKIVEKEVLDNFKKILGDNITSYTSVCETPKNDEHDILILSDRDLFIVEVKSSKTKEPKRDPEKGYEYIRQHFNSKKGIGGGYQQALKLMKKINGNEETILYNEKTQPFSIKKSDFDRIFLIVITADQFGLLNVNSHGLLDNVENNPLFWSCDLYNFENLIAGFKYKGKNGIDFTKYVEQRIRYFAKFLVIDELEIAEYFLVKEEYDQNIQFGRANKILFLPSSRNLFDKIKFEEKGIPYDYDSDIDCTQPILIFPEGLHYKIGRNDPCPCGSGKKYKKCHGSN